MVIFCQVAAGAEGSAGTGGDRTDGEVGEQVAAVLDALRGEIAAIRMAADCLLACIRELASTGGARASDAGPTCPLCGHASA